MEMSVSIESEDDLVVYLGKKLKSYYMKVYPHVKIIARNIMVSPDIDLLVIDENNQKTIGYEAKLLTYRKRWKRFNYEAIYKGVGQGLSYRIYGIDEAFLVIAYNKNEEIPKSGQKKIDNKIIDVANSFIFTNVSNFLGLDVAIIQNGRVDYQNVIKINKAYFPLRNNFDYRKKCILSSQFNYNKILHNKIYSV